MKINNIYCVSKEKLVQSLSFSNAESFYKVASELIFHVFIDKFSKDTLFLIPQYQYASGYLTCLFLKNGYSVSTDKHIKTDNLNNPIVLVCTVFNEALYKVFDVQDATIDVLCIELDYDFDKQLNGKICTILQ